MTDAPSLSIGPAPRLDNQTPDLFGQTPWQTVGPFFHYGLPWKGGADLVGQSDMGARPELFPEDHYLLNVSAPKGPIAGEVIEIFGAVLDGKGEPVPDAMVEIWQADAAGRYDSPDDPRSAGVNDKSFIGFGRASTSMEGVYRFRTIRPGTIPFPGGGMQAPHIALGVMGRGLLKRLVTRLYFEGAPENDADPVLALVPAARRATLIARKDPTARKDGDAWRMDIVLQGEGETVFFDC